LSGLLADGRSLIDSSNDVGTETTDLRRNLDSVQSRWKDVLQQVNQHRSDIDDRLQLWQDWRQLRDQLSHILDEVNHSLDQNPVTLCDSEQAKQLLGLYRVSRLVCAS